MKREALRWIAVVAMSSGAASAGCDRQQEAETPVPVEGAERSAQQRPGVPMASAERPPDAPQIYEAQLEQLNAAHGGGGMGRAVLTRDSGMLSIDLGMQALSPGMHLAHIHGFPSGQDATCATSVADENEDGVVDLIETRTGSGITLVPLHDAPASLEIEKKTYPVADQQGMFDYQARVPVGELEAALGRAHDIESLQLDKRVIYVHGVPQGTELPDTVRSLPGVPPRMTVPVACGIIEEQGPGGTL